MTELSLNEIYDFSKNLGEVNFSDLVKESSEHKLIPFDSTNKDDKITLKELTDGLNNFVISAKKATRFTGARVNDVGTELKETITQEIGKTKLKIFKIKGQGYPDFCVYNGEIPTYIELKVSGNKKKKETHHRLFYYTSGKKIIVEARHLLLQMELTEEKDKVWIVDSWKLRDLAKMKVSLKTEFNANQQSFDSLGEIASG